jgi:hypothetical protein
MTRGSFGSFGGEYALERRAKDDVASDGELAGLHLLVQGGIADYPSRVSHLATAFV